MIPMTPQPMMPQGQMPMGQPQATPGNMMSGLPPDIINKVLKTVTKTVSDTVSMQAQEALGQGVPWGHVLQELMKMAPPEAMSLSGGGSPPPGGGMGGNGNQPPQQPGGGMAKREDAMQAPPQQGMSPNTMQQPAPMTSRGQAQGQDLNQLLVPGGQPQQAPMQQQGQGGNWLFNPSSVDPSGAYQGASMFGGMFRTAGSEALASQQALNLQPNQQINLKKREANEVPLGIAKKEEIGLETQKAILMETAKLQREGFLKPEQLLTKYEEATKPWTELSSSYDSLKSALTNPKSGQLDFSGFNPAADLDLLYRTAKTLDPSGRVTDSDIAIQQATTGAYGDRFKRMAQKISRKGALTEEERRFMFQAATQRFKSAEKQQRIVEEGFEKLGAESGIPRERFMRNSGLAKGQLPPRSSAPQGAKGWDTEKGAWVF